MKTDLLAAGWTPKRIREGLDGCRKGIAEARRRGGPALWTYRYLFVSQYLRHRAMLREVMANA